MNNFLVTYLKKALSLAKTRRGFCAPNPAVGVVLVKEGTIIATGFHKKSGFPHAEVEAIRSAGESAKGCDLYVTLEPCCHYGKTPPCTNLIIQSGIKSVYYGFRDPNSVVSGNGAQQLEKAGIRCFFIELPEINAFYESYHYWTKYKRPWVTAKLALSLDGKIAGPKGESLILTGDELKQYTFESRKRSDATLTTINTILKDDPQLNVRLNSKEIKKTIYILDSDLRLPLTAMLHKSAERIIIFHNKRVDWKQKEVLINKNIRCIEIPRSKNGLNLNKILSIIGNDGVHDLWIEAGGHCFQSFLNKNLLNRALIYIAPKILGTHATSAFKIPFSFSEHSIQWHQYGKDAICEVQFQ
ncbi:bifunctional diaminohydroxyphosphoribosylaminopyrimidine deaminase/5-amino-6-(5-phosphoribosylamino)uracil reductase RibD [Coxiella endosymbiont of Amblyomma nuttalli]|uniref:bifunctional diaminohydroxyphosphoribosylaminopyrimidine deaminase/5-amino-6-(5-phosphoribosylamino)uracil reductase RibD n=1 Tax=Coxiella endosymbiont of Amblyomma nuttalli TaxID=2749996 RepID=UPI001BAE3E9D|nr:bifunctional diaminohydroxyphosphoribosylaminopyrimidine deaminase/5-amino-6-(5-phosphoribosylamino)uracil reductase RibD [Coxiella endosymbiont of Amblyomma nuttalli]QTS84160.1 Riboflavin biosynthesis protein RibD [Coxiella endosymbiont of Amblyomma nuttalli]